jgi:uncharacterized alkaline shock family protein YloU
MAEDKFAGETIISDEVVASIIGLAAKEVEGVFSLGKSSVRRTLTKRLAGTPGKARFGVDVQVGEKEAIVDLDLDVIYGFNIPKIVNEVRQKVASRLLEITGLVAKEINVNVVSIQFQNEKRGKKEEKESKGK